MLNSIESDVSSPLLSNPSLSEDVPSAAEPTSPPHTHATPSRYLNLSLYTSYMMAAWAWRGMEFTVALVLLDILPNSLLLVSIFGLLDNGVRVIFGGMVGRYIDKSPRLQGAVNCYVFQNLCIAAAGLGLSASLAGLLEHQSVSYWIIVSFSLVLAALASVGSSGIQISVERSFPKVLYQDSEADLSTMNATFRALDLLALLLSPIASGALMTLLKPWVAVLSLALYALVAWIPEVLLLRSAVMSSSRLLVPKVIDEPLGAKTSKWLMGESWRCYSHQPVLLACLSLSLIYCTVLSLGFLMTSFLKWSGMSEIEVSMYRGLGALTGLAATVTYATLQKWMGSARVGMLGILYQLILLAVGVCPIVVSYIIGLKARPPLFLVRLLITFVAGSRTGLWLFDLAITQIMQDNVAPQELGTVNGVQVAICASFETISFLAGLAFPDPIEFPLLMLGSLCIVASSCVLYAIYILRHSASRVEERQLELEQGNEEKEGLLNLENI